MKKFFPFIALLCFTALQSYAQQEGLISGRIVTAEDTTIGIAYAHVYNKNNEKGTTTGMGGNYRLLASPKDSLEFRMIGYVDTTLSYAQAMALNFVIPLKERVYKLRQVEVRGEHLTEPFAPETTPDDPYFGYPSVRPSGRSREEDKIGLTGGMGGTGVTGAVTALANKFNKKAKQRERIRQLKEQKRQNQYYEALFEYWFDKEIVQEITGLEGRELNRFLKFCNPSLAFLESATEYEAILAIQRYYEKYQNVNRY
ncbi:carboxypeptidase-like regulatory domain-containing protein [Nafulsella turpanensis]|uniref:carboxypeptidase-like regulatory domain-containing protein n=1 Tax=Nafulsella turpanensis TaxID=1265690 RepID=UPI00135F14DE|nr:carboxypeptidase-like regulatory domain-containing protein [Nafulsella turpanensis]